MSATHTQRVFRWGAWHGTAQREGWTVVGFEHHCGAATLVDFDGGVDGPYCTGCRFELDRPEECRPLYQPAQPTSAEPGGA